jgi:hypothetical protein
VRVRHLAAAAVVAALPTARSPALCAQGAPRAPVESVTVTPGAQYEAGPLHRALLGTDYRALWATPFRVELLDLDRIAGGLSATERGGGLQTRSLRLKGADGREYVFRSLDKDHGRVLPPELRATKVRDIYQDQVAAFHPAAAIVVARLLDATRIRHVTPRLVVLQDSPRLGEFRADFARLLGTFEERPGKGFDDAADGGGSADDVISSDRLYARLLRNPETRVDTKGFLTARLFDVFVGDRDRHEDQWRWANFGGGDSALWEPIPRDRDMAFVRQEGLLLAIARQYYPQLVRFERTYPRMLGLGWNSRNIDRRLLSGLERAVWDSVAAALQSRLTDAVIDDAVAAMPAPLREASGARLVDALRARRDHLPDAAAALYALLAESVELHGTERADVLDVDRRDDGSVEIALASRGVVLARRRFLPQETREVRVYLHGGADRVTVRGRARGMTVRVVAGGATFADPARGRADTRFYDTSGTASDVRVDRRPYAAPTHVPDSYRDWGHDALWSPWVSSGPDVGPFVGATRSFVRYGFRAAPYESRLTLQGGWAFGAQTGRAQLIAERHLSNSEAVASLVARASGIEVLRFHGFGNASPNDQPSASYHVAQRLFLVQPTYATPLARGLVATLSVLGQYTTTHAPDESVLARTRPYGSGPFGELGAQLGLALDTRDAPQAPTRGVSAFAGVRAVPAVWDVERAFGDVHAEAATYLSARGTLAPTLALRAGGKRLVGGGALPFHEAAFVGGAATLRGWGEQRFAGRGAAYGNAELRLRLGRPFLIVPTDVGVFGLTDVGRVFDPADRSDAWHTGAGGGVWIAPLRRSNTLSFAVVRGGEKTGVYFRSGFLF